MAANFAREVLIGSLSAAAVGGLTLIWNWGTQGGIIRALGGITQSDLQVAIGQKSSEQLVKSDKIPSGIVSAFASRADVADAKSHCPEYWSPFEEARGRIIVGAGIPGKANFEKWDQIQGDGKTIIKRDLSRYRPFDTGGEEKHYLTVDEMPKHSHQYDTEWGSDGNRSGRQDATFGRTQGQTSVSGNGQEHNIMSPYIAMYYCIKN